MEGRMVTPGSQAAVLAALAMHNARQGRGSSWMAAADLASFVGARGVDDPQFEAVVRSLYSAGAIRLMVEDTSGEQTGFKAMLVRPV